MEDGSVLLPIGLLVLLATELMRRMPLRYWAMPMEDEAFKRLARGISLVIFCFLGIMFSTFGLLVLIVRKP